MYNFLPNEVARLVLDYLKEIECNRSYETFLDECIFLADVRWLVRRGEPYHTLYRCSGPTTLLAILKSYNSLFEKDLDSPLDASKSVNVTVKDASTNTDEPLDNVLETPPEEVSSPVLNRTLQACQSTQSNVQSQESFHSPMHVSHSSQASPERNATCSKSNIRPSSCNTGTACAATSSKEMPSTSGSTAITPSITNQLSKDPLVEDSLHSSPHHSLISTAVQCDNTSSTPIADLVIQSRTLVPETGKTGKSAILNSSVQTETCTSTVSASSSSASVYTTNSSSICEVTSVQTSSIATSPLVTNEMNRELVSAAVTTQAVSRELPMGTPSKHSEPFPYRRAPATNSPRLILSFDRSLLPSLSTPMKDPSLFSSEMIWKSPRRKSCIPKRKLLSDASPRPTKQMTVYEPPDLLSEELFSTVYPAMVDKIVEKINTVRNEENVVAETPQVVAVPESTASDSQGIGKEVMQRLDADPDFRNYFDPLVNLMDCYDIFSNVEENINHIDDDTSPMKFLDPSKDDESYHPTTTTATLSSVVATTVCADAESMPVTVLPTSTHGDLSTIEPQHTLSEHMNTEMEVPVASTSVQVEEAFNTCQPATCVAPDGNSKKQCPNPLLMVTIDETEDPLENESEVIDLTGDEPLSQRMIQASVGQALRGVDGSLMYFVPDSASHLSLLKDGSGTTLLILPTNQNGDDSSTAQLCSATNGQVAIISEQQIAQANPSVFSLLQNPLESQESTSIDVQEVEPSAVHNCLPATNQRMLQPILPLSSLDAKSMQFTVSYPGQSSNHYRPTILGRTSANPGVQVNHCHKRKADSTLTRKSKRGRQESQREKNIFVISQNVSNGCKKEDRNSDAMMPVTGEKLSSPSVSDASQAGSSSMSQSVQPRQKQQPVQNKHKRTLKPKTSSSKHVRILNFSPIRPAVKDPETMASVYQAKLQEITSDIECLDQQSGQPNEVNCETENSVEVIEPDSNESVSSLPTVFSNELSSLPIRKRISLQTPFKDNPQDSSRLCLPSSTTVNSLAANNCTSSPIARKKVSSKRKRIISLSEEDYNDLQGIPLSNTTNSSPINRGTKNTQVQSSPASSTRSRRTYNRSCKNKASTNELIDVSTNSDQEPSPAKPPPTKSKSCKVRIVDNLPPGVKLPYKWGKSQIDAYTSGLTNIAQSHVKKRPTKSKGSNRKAQASNSLTKTKLPSTPSGKKSSKNKKTKRKSKSEEQECSESEIQCEVIPSIMTMPAVITNWTARQQTVEIPVSPEFQPENVVDENNDIRSVENSPSTAKSPVKGTLDQTVSYIESHVNLRSTVALECEETMISDSQESSNMYTEFFIATATPRKGTETVNCSIEESAENVSEVESAVASISGCSNTCQSFNGQLNEEQPVIPKLQKHHVSPQLDKRPVTPQLEYPIFSQLEGPVSPKEHAVTPELNKRPVSPQLNKRPVSPQLNKRPVTPQLEYPNSPQLEGSVSPQSSECAVTPQCDERPVTPQCDERPVTPQLNESPGTPQLECSVSSQSSERAVTPQRDEQLVASQFNDERPVTPQLNESPGTPQLESPGPQLECSVFSQSSERAVTPQLNKHSVAPQFNDEQPVPLSSTSDNVPMSTEVMKPEEASHNTPKPKDQVKVVETTSSEKGGLGWLLSLVKSYSSRKSEGLSSSSQQAVDMEKSNSTQMKVPSNNGEAAKILNLVGVEDVLDLAHPKE